jgi:mycothiol synthase
MDPIAQLGLRLRRPTPDDLQPVVDLFVASEIEQFGEPQTDSGEVRDFWRQMDLSADAWVVTDASGTPIAYADVNRHRPVQLEAWAVVDRTWRRRGIGSRLLALAEERASEMVDRAPAGARVGLGVWVNAQVPGFGAFARRHGFEAARRFWRMRIDMGDEPPDPPRWPEGIAVRTFEPGRDERATFEASEEAFEDHWGHVPNEFAEWLKRTEGDSFDPTLWFLALDGDTIVGTSLCGTYLEIGWVGTLGVRRPWRGRGLGEALLRHSFVEFHRRGRRAVALGVDADSLTGATRLYERAGMHVDQVHELYTKVVREGEAIGAAGW